MVLKLLKTQIYAAINTIENSGMTQSRWVAIHKCYELAQKAVEDEHKELDMRCVKGRVALSSPCGRVRWIPSRSLAQGRCVVLLSRLHYTSMDPIYEIT